MTLRELEEQLRFARQLGAEDNDIVYINALTKRFSASYDDKGDLVSEEEFESWREHEEPNRATLQRNGKREIVIE